MTELHVGEPKIDLRGKRRFLFIDDEIPSPRQFKGAKVFDFSKHSYNPLQRPITATAARLLTQALYALYPQGQNTLTVRKGIRTLPSALQAARRLDLVTGSEEIDELIQDITFSPLIKNVLCNRTNFSLNPTSATFLRLNRAEIGEFDALALGLIFINAFKGQIIIPDFNFYGRDIHVGLIRQNRLIAGIRSLTTTRRKAPELHDELLPIKTVHLHRALYDDAVLFAKYAGLRPDPLRENNDYNTYIAAAIAPPA